MAILASALALCPACGGDEFSATLEDSGIKAIDSGPDSAVGGSAGVDGGDASRGGAAGTAGSAGGASGGGAAGSAGSTGGASGGGAAGAGGSTGGSSGGGAGGGVVGGQSGSAGLGGSSGTAGEAGKAGAAGTLADAGPEADVQLDSGPEAGVCDPNETPANGVFVSAASTGSQDGSAVFPFSTLQAGIEHALAVHKTVIYIDEGTYTESPNAKADVAGLTLRGGWQKKGSSWARDCSATAKNATLIASPTTIGLSVVDAAGPVRVETISIYTKPSGASPADQAGESLYGLYIVNSQVSLSEVEITAGLAGDGGATTKVLAGGVASCADLIGGCGNGAAATDGADGAPAQAGSFSASGYHPGDGKDGGAGPAGSNGTPGAAGASKACVSGCSGGGGPCATLWCGDLAPQTVSAEHGLCGCGGPGGAAGGAGHGGGASIGVLVAGSSAKLTVKESTLKAQDGGDGSAGLSGQAGGSGTAGKKGANAWCPGSCTAVGSGNCNCEQPGGQQLLGGNAGGAGGQGAKGGTGSGGAGGPSYALVSLGGATVDLGLGVSLAYGLGGQGSNAPAGGAQEQLVVP